MTTRARRLARAGAAPRIGAKRPPVIGLTFVIAIVASAAVAVALPDDTVLISRATGVAGDKGNATSEDASISANGRYVALESLATNLPDDADAVRDIFVRDRVDNTTELVSRADGAAGAKGTLAASDPVISADGRHVAFVTASKLEADDGDSSADVYVRDLVSDVTTLASVSSAEQNSIAEAQAPSISADGRYVTFHTLAAFDAADTDPAALDVYRRDLVAGETALVSLGVNGGTAEAASISADGRYVSFESDVANLTADDPDTTRDVFRRDMSMNATVLVSRADGAAGAKGNGASNVSAISADGRYVAFLSGATNLDPADGSPGIDVYWRDVQDGVTKLASRETGATGFRANQGSLRPAISGNGRYVAFDTTASNLNGDTPPAKRGVFVRDVVANATLLASRADGKTGEKGNGDAMAASISADGGFVAFDSIATNLEAADQDATRDVYVRSFDVTPPQISAPSDITLTASDASGAVVTFTVDATDDSGIVTVDCTADSGDTFPIGTTPVTCTAVDGVGNTASAAFTVTVNAPPAPGGGTGGGGDGGGAGAGAGAGGGAGGGAGDGAGGPPATAKETAKLSLKRATIDRSRRLLEVLAPITARASGSVDIELRSGGKRVRFTAPIDAAKARIRVRKRIPAAAAKQGSGILTITYAGDADTRSQTVRLRAAPRPAQLKLTRPTLVAGRLRASGTVARAARGVVRVQLEYVHDGATKTVAFKAPIRNGRFALDTALAADVLAQIDARTGTVHSYTLFTGYQPNNVRGEMAAAQVLGAA